MRRRGRMRYGGGGGGERGFTLVELMISVALLGMGLAYVTTVFLRGWENWKRNYTDVTTQRDGRIALDLMAQGIRQARPMAVKIDNVTGEAWFSRISFTHVKEQKWTFWKEGGKLYKAVDSSTMFLCDGVQALQFTYPNLSDFKTIDIGLTITRPTFQLKTLTVQLTQRVGLRNP